MYLDTQVKLFIYNKDNHKRTDHLKAIAYKAVSFLTDVSGSCSFKENYLSYQKDGIKLSSVDIACIYDGQEAQLIETFINKLKKEVKLQDKLVMQVDFEDV